MALNGWAYLGAFVASLSLSWVLTPLALRVALRRELLDRPELHKSHSSPVPYLGGVAIVLAFSIAVIGAAAVTRPVGTAALELAVVLGCAVALSLVGLVDDLRGLSPAVRVVCEVGAGVALWASGTGVLLFDVPALNAVVTVLWVVGVTNAYNLLDNMDGLSAGIAAISAAFFFLLAAFNGQFLVAALAAGLAGCALGFLRHNYHPARIYMGDAGSLFLGFMLAAIGIKLRFDGPTQVTFLVPILVTGVAVFDTTLVTISRLLHRRPVMMGGRDHTSHRLVFVGIPVRGAVALIYGGGISLGWLAVVVARVDVLTAWVVAGFVVAVAVFAGVMLSLVPVYESSRRRRMMIVEVAEHEPEPVVAPAAAGNQDSAPPVRTTEPLNG